MEKINQYYKITNIKPEYHILDPPYYVPSKKRIIFNGKELELHYLNEFKTYLENETFKIGGFVGENLEKETEEEIEKNKGVIIFI